jgi:membrane fusion protein (multidrug efflux system)
MGGRKALGIGIMLLSLIALLILGGKLVHYRLTHAITNAVFVESDTFTKVAYRRVGGRVLELYKEEGSRVKKGEALAKIEDKDYRIKIEELEREIKGLEKEIEAIEIRAKTTEEELRERKALVRAEEKALRKRIEALKAKKELLLKDRDRFQRLQSRGVIPTRKFEEIETQLKAVDREIEALKYKRKALLSQIDVLRAKLKQVKALYRRAEALRKKREALLKKGEDLENMLSETVLRSPIDGYVVKRFVSIGEVVRPGQFIYAVYDPQDLYILVLLEETKLKGVREGNRAFIEIDALPDVKFEGVVKEINRATAAKFALIPRDITAGEFTKVAQRIPIKVEITRGDTSLLRVGMGGEVAIELSP